MQRKSDKQVLESLIFLKNSLGHEPNVFEINAYKHLPNARTLQRRFGGVQKLREMAGFTHLDHTKGAIRSEKAAKSQKLASKYESDIINALFNKYHDVHSKNKTVIRHYAYQQYLPDKGHYINITCDAAIHDIKKKHIFMFDFFYPSTQHSLYGCVRSKLKKLQKNPPQLFDATCSITFVCMNPEMEQDDMTAVNTDLRGATLLAIDTFKKRWLG